MAVIIIRSDFYTSINNFLPLFYRLIKSKYVSDLTLYKGELKTGQNIFALCLSDSDQLKKSQFWVKNPQIWTIC